MELEKILTRPLPAEAIKPPQPNGGGKGLSSIKTVYVTERLNEAYGRGQWSLHVEDMGAVEWQQKTKNGEKERTMYTAKVKTTITLPNGTVLQCIATSQNDDEGDASKGAISDCISKIGSWLGIGAHVWKGQSLEQAWAEWQRKYPPTYEEELARLGGKHLAVLNVYAQALGVAHSTPSTAKEAEDMAREFYKKYYGLA